MGISVAPCTCNVATVQENLHMCIHCTCKNSETQSPRCMKIMFGLSSTDNLHKIPYEIMIVFKLRFIEVLQNTSILENSGLLTNTYTFY